MISDQKVRVCIVVASLDILGGQAVQAARLIAELSREPGVEVELLPINPRLPGLLRYLQRIKYVRTVVTSILYIALLLVRLPRFDVIHVFSASYLSFLLAPTPALLVAKLYGKPALLNYHSGEAEDHLRRWRRTALPVIRLADRVVVPSDYLVEVFKKFGIKAEAVSNTVDLSRFTFRRRANLRPILLSNRNLESHYNVEGVVRAFALIQREMPEARLLVAGVGSQRPRLQALVADLRLHNVEFLGAVPPAEMPALYDRADIFVNASDVDNMPLSIIEAFACGLAVVTTDAGGIPYMVAHDRNGIMVQRGDHEAMARGVLMLLNNHHLANRLVGAARVECLKYTWDAVRTGWLSLYSELARKEIAGAKGVGLAANDKLPMRTN